MAHFRSFKDAKFKEALEKRDDIWLKGAVINAIKNDPSFSTGEADLAVRCIESSYGELFESYKKIEGEDEAMQSQPDKWDFEYFSGCAYYLELNFCKERIEILRKVGQKISGRVPTQSDVVQKPANTTVHYAPHSPTASSIRQAVSNTNQTTSYSQPQAADGKKDVKKKDGDENRPHPTKPPMTEPDKRYGLMAAAIAVVVILVLILLGLNGLS